MQCTVVTPESTIFDAPVKFVALPLFDGEIGIAPGHSPLIGRLGYGEMRITGENGTVERFYVDGGFVQVVGGAVSVLTNRAIPAKEIDPAIAAEQLTAARLKPANSDELLAIRDRSVWQARGQLRVARKARGGAAASH